MVPSADRRRLIVVCALVPALLAPVSPAVGSPRTLPGRAADTCRPWKVITSPPVSFGALEGVSGTSADDVWTVGNDLYDPFIEHWDGIRWSLVPPAPQSTSLRDVVAITSTDAWAVGTGYANEVQHWNGTRWVQFPAPQPYGYIFGTDASSSTDVWAVGSFTDDWGIHPLALHWDGATWSHVPAPDGTPNGTNVFYDVSAVSATDAWAVGYQDVTGGADFQPLIEHWDGSNWTVVGSPPLEGDNNQLLGVSARTDTEAWAVGIDSLLEHWDGTSWSVQEPLTPAAFIAVDALSSTQVWAVGVRAGYPLAQRYNGSKWFLTQTPSPGENGGLVSVDALTSTDIWTVGHYFSNQTGTTPLILHSNGRCSG